MLIRALLSAWPGCCCTGPSRRRKDCPGQALISPCPAWTLLQMHVAAPPAPRRTLDRGRREASAAWKAHFFARAAHAPDAKQRVLSSICVSQAPIHGFCSAAEHAVRCCPPLVPHTEIWQRLETSVGSCAWVLGKQSPCAGPLAELVQALKAERFASQGCLAPRCFQQRRTATSQRGRLQTSGQKNRCQSLLPSCGLPCARATSQTESLLMVVSSTPSEDWVRTSATVYLRSQDSLCQENLPAAHHGHAHQWRGTASGASGRASAETPCPCKPTRHAPGRSGKYLQSQASDQEDTHVISRLPSISQHVFRLGACLLPHTCVKKGTHTSGHPLV